MERPRSISRRDLLRSGAVAAGAVVSACSHDYYLPAEYTINSPAGADRYQAMQTEFEGVTPIQIMFRPHAAVHSYDVPVWRVNSAALRYPEIFTSSSGQMQILVDRDYKDPGENKK